MSIATEMELFGGPDVEREIIDLDPRQAQSLKKELDEKTIAVQEDPADPSAVLALEGVTSDVAEVAIRQPEVVPVFERSLGKAAKTLDAVKIIPPDDLEAAQILAKVAGVTGEDDVVALAKKRIDQYHANNHAPANQLGAKLDTQLAEEWKNTIPTIGSENILGVPEPTRVDKIINDVAPEIEIDPVSPLAVAKNDSAMLRSGRIAAFRRKGEKELETTGVTPVDEEPGNLPDADTPGTDTEIAPSPSDAKAYTSWKRRLANRISYRAARIVMQDDENERLVTTDDIRKFRIEQALEQAREAAEESELEKQRSVA